MANKKNRHITIIAGVLVAFVLLLVGSLLFFNNQDDPDTITPSSDLMDIYLHFADNDLGWGVELGQIMTTTRQEKVQDAVRLLVQGPRSMELLPSVPESISVAWVNLDIPRNTVHISFYPGFEHITLLERVTLIASMVHTLTELEFVEYVVFYDGDDELVSGDGQPFGARNRANTPLGGEVPQAAPVEIVLFYPDQQAMGLFAELRSVPFDETQTNIETLIINSLLQGPKTYGLVSPFGEDISLNNSVTTMGELAVVDFTLSFRDILGRGSRGEELLVFSIVNTLTQLEGIERVQIFVDGQQIAYDQQEGFHFDFSSPFDRDISLIIQTEDQG